MWADGKAPLYCDYGRRTNQYGEMKREEALNYVVRNGHTNQRVTMWFTGTHAQWASLSMRDGEGSE